MKKKKSSLSKRIERLEILIAELCVDQQHICQLLRPLEEFCYQMRDLEATSRATQTALAGVEIAVARLIPKEQMRFLPQFQIPSVLIERREELQGYLL